MAQGVLPSTPVNRCQNKIPEQLSNIKAFSKCHCLNLNMVKCCTCDVTCTCSIYIRTMFVLVLITILFIVMLTIFYSVFLCNHSNLSVKVQQLHSTLPFWTTVNPNSN